MLYKVSFDPRLINLYPKRLWAQAQDKKKPFYYEKLSAEQLYYDYYRASQFSRTPTNNMAYNTINSTRFELLSKNNYDT